MKSGVCLAKGYKATGVSAGIKASGKPDLALIVSDKLASAAGVFTSNRVKAAPVLVSQEHLRVPEIKAVVMSSGNANAATGQDGIDACKQMCAEVARGLSCKPEEVLIAQTGLIGIPFKTSVALAGISSALLQLEDEGSEKAAQAIMTTDTKPKNHEVFFDLNGVKVSVGGIAKGAAMLSPSMATMLALVTSDASVSPSILHQALVEALEDSFHSMSVDGCQSTNDTVFLLANGASGAKKIDSADSSEYRAFAAAVSEVCKSLAKQMAADAEGSSKFLIMEVVGAKSKRDAKLAAMGVVRSTLVKCSLAGQNSYWGRVISELGASGADFDPNDVEISYGPYKICEKGMALEHDTAAVEKYMLQREIEITAKIGSGPGHAKAYGCDLTHAYVDENMGKS